jgi:hypothetical protein
MYVGKTEMPSPQSNIASSEGNKLVMNGKKGVYYLGVVAKEDCSYTLTGYNTDYDLVKIERGSFSDMELDSGKVKYFMFEHLSETEFKIVSIAQYGKVKIYAENFNKEKADKLKKN